MTNQPGEKQTNSDGVKDISVSDGDHHVDGFEQIGFLALRILSSIKARKKTEGANNAAPSVSFAQASLGGSLASNKTENGGTDSFVPADSLPIAARQQPPDTQMKREALKDRAVTSSGDW